MKNNRSSKKNGGFTLLEIIITFAVAAVVTSIGFVVTNTAGHGFAAEAASVRSQNTLDRLADQLNASAHTAISVFTPTSCDGDTVNHGDNKTCSQIRFDGVDKSGTNHIWGWEFASNTLKECLSYPDADSACTSYGPTTDLVKFNITPTPIANLSTAVTLSATGIKLVEKEVVSSGDPNGRIIAGNRVVVVDVADKQTQREIHLLQGGAPFSTAVLKGSFVPPNLGNLSLPGSITPATSVIFNSVASVNCAYASGSASPCAITATETNYAQYEPYIPAPYWTIGSCPIANFAQSGGGDSVTYTITPLAAGTCTVPISSHDQSSSITVTIYATPSYTLTSTNPAGTINVGQSTSLNATASLDAPPAGATYPPGTPGTAQVGVTSLTNQGTVINLSPSGFQSSGTTFNLTGAGGGSTDGTVGVDISSIPSNSTTNGAPFNFHINVNNPVLNPGNPFTTSLTYFAIGVDSSPPTGGSGTGYKVSYLTDKVGASCGPVTYGCTLNGLTINTAYTITATYSDSAGQTATRVFSGITPFIPPPPATPTPTPIGTPTPGPGVLAVSPTLISFANPTSAGSSVTRASESGYAGLITIDNPSDCTTRGIANISYASGTSPLSIAVSPIGSTGGGLCSVGIRDDHGGFVVLLVNVGAPGSINFSPPTLTFAQAGAPAQSTTISEAGYNGTFKYSTTCGGNYGTTPTSGDGVTGPSQTYSVKPNTNGVNCTYTATDTFGRSATLTLTTLTPGTSTCSDQPLGADLGSGYVSNGTRCPLLINGVNAGTNITIYTPGDGTHPTSASFNVKEYHTASTINDSTNCTLSSFSPTSYPGSSPLGYVGGNSTIVSQPGVTGICTITVSDGVQSQAIIVTVLALVGATPKPPPTPTPGPVVLRSGSGYDSSNTTCRGAGPPHDPRTVDCYSTERVSNLYSVTNSDIGGGNYPCINYTSSYPACTGDTVPGGVWLYFTVPSTLSIINFSYNITGGFCSDGGPGVYSLGQSLFKNNNNIQSGPTTYGTSGSYTYSGLFSSGGYAVSVTSDPGCNVDSAGVGSHFSYTISGQ